jgi:HJR/Mrr/RecB family endonuclease
MSYLAATTATTLAHHEASLVTAPPVQDRTIWALVGLVVAASVGCLMLLRLSQQLARRRRTTASGIRQVDALAPDGFESYVADMLVRLGYKVEPAKRFGQFGADLVATTAGVTYSVRLVKADRRLGVNGATAVQEVLDGQNFFNCQAAMLVTNQPLSAPVKRLAGSSNVVVWDREVLMAKILLAEQPLVPAPYRLRRPAPLSSSGVVALAREHEVVTLTGPGHCSVCGKPLGPFRGWSTESMQALPDAFCAEHEQRARRFG